MMYSKRHTMKAISSKNVGGGGAASILENTGFSG